MASFVSESFIIIIDWKGKERKRKEKKSPWKSLHCSYLYSICHVYWWAQNPFLDMIFQMGSSLELLLLLTRSGALFFVLLFLCSFLLFADMTKRKSNESILYHFFLWSFIIITVWRSCGWRKQGIKYMGYLHKVTRFNKHYSSPQFPMPNNSSSSSSLWVWLADWCLKSK